MTSFTNFLAGVVDKESYKQLVANFYFIYRAMEEEVDKLKGDPIVSKIAYDELNRVNNLERDLRYFYGPNWRAIITPSDACQQYVNRIREVADEDPELLVGHHYTWVIFPVVKYLEELQRRLLTFQKEKDYTSTILKR